MKWFARQTALRSRVDEWARMWSKERRRVDALGKIAVRAQEWACDWTRDPTHIPCKHELCRLLYDERHLVDWCSTRLEGRQ